MDAYIERLSPSARIKLAFVIVVVLATAIVSMFAAGYTANHHRIKEIQDSRVKSCQTTYHAFIDVFQPFLPKPPLTKKQQAQRNSFYARVNHLIRNCSKQVVGENTSVPTSTLPVIKVKKEED